MSKKKFKPEDVKSMVAHATAVKIVPVVKRIDNLKEMLEQMQKTLAAIQKRLNIAPDNPDLDVVENDPMSKVRTSPMGRLLNPLVFPEKRRAVEKVFAKRGWRDGDTVESVLAEAESLDQRRRQA
jgi:hypothetical protein